MDGIEHGVRDIALSNFLQSLGGSNQRGEIAWLGRHEYRDRFRLQGEIEGILVKAQQEIRTRPRPHGSLSIEKLSTLT